MELGDAPIILLKLVIAAVIRAILIPIAQSIIFMSIVLQLECG